MNDLLTVLDYHAWATGRLLTALAPLSPDELARDLHSSHGGVSGTLAHLYGSDQIWTARLRGEPALTFDGLPPLLPLPALGPQWAALQAVQRDVVAALEPDQRLSYVNVMGEAQRSSVSEIVRHIVNHATYHRGQVVAMLRQLGATAPNTDLIAFYRLQTN
ncbi:DinB family protein [Deinococcus sp. KNUC1210]|uniref:DinB family protein n=1 Tax=Deinococcus sp. KNUC1210 TaxID=2917691 RepID=UPI001EEF8C79|nr:DinB family protein [Deinococcus sp. KNUC1210]ULH14398.1 DinB family protein [Deinococcus sp. KNUC1210]